MATTTTTPDTSKTDTAQAIAMLAVTTVPTANVAKGLVQITAATRATTDKATGKKKEIPAEQRSRSILVQEYAPAVSSKYVSIVTSALVAAAKEQLGELWTKEPMLREVPAALFTEDGIFAYLGKVAERSRLTKESISEWFDASSLKTELAKNFSEKQISDFCDALQNLAATTPAFVDDKKLQQRIERLRSCEDDQEHDICRRLIAKMVSILKEREEARKQIGDAEGAL